MVRVAGGMAFESDRAADRRTPAYRQRRCACTLRGQSFPWTAAAAGARRDLAILVQHAGGETRARHLVDASVPGALRSHTTAGSRRQNYGRGIADGDAQGMSRGNDHMTLVP